jgi:CO/xanthine dehydrogenase FAD-binding subunit
MSQTATSYHDPGSLDEALEALADLGAEATVVAGGQDVVRDMNRGERSPPNIIDISGLSSLHGIDDDGDAVSIRPLVTHTELAQSDVIAEGAPLLADAKGTIGGGQQVHNLGTVGGAVCAAQPVYDYPSCLVALEATLHARSDDGEREIPAREFFEDAAATALDDHELLTGVSVPKVAGGTNYEKLKYTEGCYNIASAAAVVAVNGGQVVDARLALGGIEAVPRRLDEAEERATGETFTDDLAAKVGEMASEAVEAPLSDVHADGNYRRDMASVVTKRAMIDAAHEARAATDGGTHTEGSQ